MERLKSILADKILDLSTETGSDEIKAKLDKIHRFRDFANACKTLMVKYPAIEDELIEMVNNGDFDTKIASSRVDRVVRLSEDSSASSLESSIVDLSVNPDNIPMEVYKGEEPEIVTETQSHEELVVEKAEEPEPVVSLDSEADENMFPSEEELAVLKRKTTIRRIVVILAIALAVVVIIFIVKFVMLHWQTILIIAGIFVILAILLIWYMRKRK